MKRFLLSLMILTMFTPGLACAQIMHPQKAAISHMEMSKDMPCCPESKSFPDTGTMFFKDCMKVDLQHSGDASVLKKVDIAKSSFPFLAATVSSWNFDAAGIHAARGPPLERRSIITQSQPVYLSTLRLRI